LVILKIFSPIYFTTRAEKKRANNGTQILHLKSKDPQEGG